VAFTAGVFTIVVAPQQQMRSSLASSQANVFEYRLSHLPQATSMYSSSNLVRMVKGLAKEARPDMAGWCGG
jgi:hypothetical protein